MAAYAGRPTTISGAVQQVNSFNQPLGYAGPSMMNPYVPMTDYSGGMQGVGSPGQWMSGIDMVRGGGHYAQGIPLVKAGEVYGRGIDMVKGGASYFKGAYMPKAGSHYFNDRTIDLVDERSNTVGLEAQAGRTLSRMGGAMGADLASQGLSGGPMANMMRQSLTAEVGGNLAKDIESFNFAREEARQSGTLQKQQGILAGDTARSSADLNRRQGILAGDTARMQGQVARNQLILSGDTARQTGAISRNQLALEGDAQRMNGQLQRNQLGLSAATTNSGVSVNRALMRASDQQFGLGMNQRINEYNANNYWQNETNNLTREGLMQNNLGMAGVMPGSPPGALGFHPVDGGNARNAGLGSYGFGKG